MQLKHLYLLLCIVGTVLPLWQFIPWATEHGLNVPLFFEHLFANGVAGAFGMDVIVSSVVLWVMVLTDGRRAGVRHLWAPLVANIVAGVSSGLPLFLYLRARTGN
jgi:hypothetical protein